MTHSGSGALLMAIEVLCEPGSVMLVPTPGFGLYQCHADARGVRTRLYKLLVCGCGCVCVCRCGWVWGCVQENPEDTG